MKRREILLQGRVRCCGCGRGKKNGMQDNHSANADGEDGDSTPSRADQNRDRAKLCEAACVLTPPLAATVQITSLSMRSTGLLPEPDELVNDSLPCLPICVTATATATAKISPQCLSSEQENKKPAEGACTLSVDDKLLPSGWKQPQQVHPGEGGLGELLQFAQVKLLEHGFSTLDGVALLQIEEELAVKTSLSVVQTTCAEVAKRMVEVLNQYGRRGQLVQELILSAETAARRNERLAVDNKELALQIADLTQRNARAPHAVENCSEQHTNPGKDDHRRHIQRLEADLHDAKCKESDAAESARRAREELSQLHALLLDTRQDLAVSLRREAGLSAEKRHLEQHHAAERERMVLSCWRPSVHLDLVINVCMRICVRCDDGSDGKDGVNDE